MPTPLAGLPNRRIARRFLSYVKFGQNAMGLTFFWGFLSVRSRHGTEHGPFTIRVIYPPRFPESGDCAVSLLDESSRSLEARPGLAHRTGLEVMSFRTRGVGDRFSEARFDG